MRASIPSFHVDLRQALRLPHRHGGTFLTDGGQITELVFFEGIDLPHLAASTPLDSEARSERLKKIL
jgi:hypothetical protein